MHIVKPLWLSHAGENRDHEVYSCHVSSDGKRLVTAAGDSYVRIWSTEAILNSHDPSYTGPRQLAAISTHSGTIHAVRFSGNNKYLASGADDRIVCIYGIDTNAPTITKAFGSNEQPPVENWRVIRRLVGHDNDVQDLAWSYDSSILVSVGLDSKVVVWSGHTFEKLKTLSQHQSHVKGITFDPAGKYFATSSDDRTIKIFRFWSPPPNATAHDQVSNFMLEATISLPFAGSPLTTYFRRCSWSPDGLHIAAANAMNGPVSSVAIITRGNWESPINFIGHEGPVEVSAFCPRMFHKEKPDPNSSIPQGTITVVACGGQDKALSIWNTSLTRPQVITQALSNKAISDLCWSPEGDNLFITTLDGSILTVVFEIGELGYVAPQQENENALSRFGAGRKAGIVEGPDALLLEDLSKADEIKGVQGRMGALMGDASAALPAINGSELARTNGASTTNGTSTPAEAQQAAPAATSISATEAKINQLKQRVEIVGGKKRVKPLLISGASAPTSNLPQTQLLANTQALRQAADGPHAVLDLSKPYDGLPEGGLRALLIGNKRKWAEIAGDEERRTEKRMASMTKDSSAPLLVNGDSGLTPPGLDRQQVERPSPIIMNPALITSQVRLATPVLRGVIMRTADGSDPAKANDSGDILLLEARNATGPSRIGRQSERDPTRINCTRAGVALWQDYLPRPVSLTTGNKHFWAAACEDGALYVWTPAGRRLLNALVLEAQPVIMDCRGWWLMCITAVGLVHVWNIKDLQSPHPPVSLAPVFDIALQTQGPHLTGTPGIVFARLNTRGKIVVAMTNGDGYTYSPGMYVWQRLSETWFAVGSQYWNTTDTAISTVSTGAANTTNGEEDSVMPENLSAGIIPLLERNTTAQSLLRGRAFMVQRLIKALLVAEGFEGFEANVSVAHLENRLAAAMTLGAREEFKIYLMMYAKRIGAEGLKAKVEELLRLLLGDGAVAESNTKAEDGRGWYASGDVICGWNRMDLLKDVVLILGKHRDIQRLTVPFARLLGVVENRPVGNGDTMIE